LFDGTSLSLRGRVHPIAPQMEGTSPLRQFIGRRVRQEVREGRRHIPPARERRRYNNMVYGAAAAGQRVMTASVWPGLSLMPEGNSYLAGSAFPCVTVDAVRGDPVLGNITPEPGDEKKRVTSRARQSSFRSSRARLASLSLCLRRRFPCNRGAHARPRGTKYSFHRPCLPADRIAAAP